MAVGALPDDIQPDQLEDFNSDQIVEGEIYPGQTFEVSGQIVVDFFENMDNAMIHVPVFFPSGSTD